VSAGSREQTDKAVLALLRTSLAVWGADANVEIAPDAVAVVHTGELTLRIARAPSTIPFRWVVRYGMRERPAASVNGLLRIVREVVEPGWHPGRARVVPLDPGLASGRALGSAARGARGIQ
jgi:hypothetical protein